MITELKHERAATPQFLPVDPPKQSIVRLVLPGIVLVLACLLPFLNKAYTNDDPFFLFEARQILKTPLNPLSFSMCWGGTLVCYARESQLGTAQGLMGYLLAPVMAAGGSEWLAHLLQVLLACLSVVEMVRVALRLGFDRVLAAAGGVLLVVNTPFLTMASCAMPDTAAVALGLTGIERLLAWKDEKRWHQAIMAGLAMGLAQYARPHLALLMPLGALWLFDGVGIRKALSQLRRQAYLWTPIVIAAVVFVTVQRVTRDGGSGYLPSRFVVFRTDNTLRNLFSYLQYLTFPIPFAIIWLAVHWRRTPIRLAIPAILILVLHFSLSPSENPLHAWPQLASLYGLVALSDVLYRCWRPDGDWCNRMLSLWLMFPLSALIYVHMPLKYMVGVMPAIVLLLLRTLSELPRPRATAIFSGVTVLCTGLSVLLLVADADFANCGRRAAAELIAPHANAGEKVWYGGIMGWYWYAQEAGATIVKPGEPGPKPGELLAIGVSEMGESALKQFPNRELVDSRHYRLPHGRIWGSGGGLYTNGSGNAPWVWTPDTPNDYQLWRIR